MKRLDTKPKYRKFVNARDKAAEAMLLKARAKVSDELRHFMNIVQSEVIRTYHGLNREFMDPITQHQIRMLDESLDRHARDIAIQMAQHWVNLRAHIYMLTHAGEQQASINVRGGRPKHVPHDQIHKAAYAPTAFGPIVDRAYLSLSRLRRAVIDAIEMSRIMGDEIKPAVERVMRVFPKPDRITSQRVMKRLTEAAQDGSEEDRFGFSAYMADDDWQEIVNEYKGEFVPKWRDPSTGRLETPVSVGTSEEYAVYPWQLEKEITEDFVSSVIAGTNEGASAQGITDFVWNSILDDRTDECCVKRDGLTVSEIRAKLKGDWSGDECRASVPPAHFNCRCRIAPATDDLPDMPESNAAEFEDWLDS